MFRHALLFHCELVKVSLRYAKPDLRNTGEVEGTQREMSQMPTVRRELVRKTELFKLTHKGVFVLLCLLGVFQNEKTI